MDPYWTKLRAVYATFSDSIPPAERWERAYTWMLEVGGELKGPPVFDPPMSFQEVYAQAVAYMMFMRTSHLSLPKNFMEDWRKAPTQEQLVEAGKLDNGELVYFCAYPGGSSG